MGSLCSVCTRSLYVTGLRKESTVSIYSMALLLCFATFYDLLCFCSYLFILSSLTQKSKPETNIHFETVSLKENRVVSFLHIYLLPPTEADFLDVIRSKALRVFLLAIRGHIY